MIFVDVDHDVLDRFVLDALALGENDLRFGDRHFVTFAAHRLDQDRKMQLAPPAHFKGVGALGIGDA